MIHVVIADDHEVLREGVAALVRAQSDMHLDAQAANAEDVVKLCQHFRPDVAVIDLGMPGGGIAAIQNVTTSCPGVRTVAFTVHDDDAHVRATFAAGGTGYVMNMAAGSQLIDAIRSVAAGQSLVLGRGGGSGNGGPLQRNSPRPVALLSLRERQVLEGLVRGFSNREIAEKLELSPKTVDTYRARLQNKLGAGTRAELVDYALRVGILSPQSEGGSPAPPSDDDHA